MEAKTPLDRAKEKVGGNVGLAAGIGGISPQAVSQWDRVPATRVLVVERLSGVPRHELRPDIYPKEVRSRPLRQAGSVR